MGWEGVGLCSYLLIGFWYTDTDKASAGKKAFVVNRIGDAGFIIAMALLYRTTGTLQFVHMASSIPHGTLTAATGFAACLFLLVGATGKSAQLPLFVWLPDAMAGPTPVSALIHAATMVTAGVYLTARMSFLFSAVPAAMLVVAIVGALTALFAATIAAAQNDIKKVLAYSTISQLGFMFAAVGVGAYAAAVAHLVTHAFFKACLFLGAGSVIHGLGGEQDLRQMGGLRHRMPTTYKTFALATLAITGLIPGLSGFITKDAILFFTFTAGRGAYDSTFVGWSVLLWCILVVTAALTSFYMWRLVFLAFFSGELRAPAETAARVHESPAVMTLPLVVLAALSVVGGVIAWPHIFHGHDFIRGFLSPVVGPGPQIEVSVGLELALMSMSVLAAALGFTVAYTLFGKGINPVAYRFASERPWLWCHARLSGKWHIDELYNAAVVQPLNWTSRLALREGVERRLIDGFLELLASIARNIGFLGQVLQNGNVQRYLAAFVIALALLLYGWLLPFNNVTPGNAAIVPPATGMSAAAAPAANASPNSDDRRTPTEDW